jgi:hypothetical protein
LETVNPARGSSYSPAEIAAAVVESLQNMIPGWLRNPSPSHSRTPSPSPPPQITETAPDDQALMNNLLEHYERYSQRLQESIRVLQEQIGTQRNQHTRTLHRTVTDYQELLQDIQNQRDQLRMQRDNQALNFQAQSSSQQLQFQQHLDQVRAAYQQQLNALHARYEALTSRLVENEERQGRSRDRSEQGGRSRSESLARRIARYLAPELIPALQQNDLQQNIMNRLETLGRDQQFHRLQQQRNQQHRRNNRRSWIPRMLRGNNNS